MKVIIQENKASKTENISVNKGLNAEEMQENIFLYDWITFTTKIHSISGVKKLLGLEKIEAAEWTIKNGRYLYRDMLEYGNICIMYNGRAENMGICVEMSGQGCRTFETHGNGNYETLFEAILSEPADMNISRLDVAYDDHTGVLNLSKMCNDTRRGKFISYFKTAEINETLKNGKFKKDSEFLKSAQTLYFGSRTSAARIRIYDKAEERGYTDKHWIRAELVLKGKNALSFISHKGTIGEKFTGVVKNLLRFVKKTGSDGNMWRWETADYWRKFIGGAEKISLYQKPGIEYNESMLHAYVVKQAGNSINTYREIYGDAMLLKVLSEHKKTAVFNEKQKNLIRKYRNEKMTVKDDLMGIYDYIDKMEKYFILEDCIYDVKRSS